MEDAQDERSGIQSVEVGFALLQALAAAPRALMLRDAADAAGMPSAKAHRYLVSFQRLGLVVQEAQGSRYALGPQALHLGLAALARIDGVALARDRLAPFKDAHGVTVAVAVWGNRGPTLVHWNDARQGLTVNLRLGDVMPLARSATGRCFLGYLPPEALLHAVEAEGIDAAKAQALRAQTRAQRLGHVQDTLVPGIVGFAAPVFNADAQLALAIVALGSSHELDTRPTGAVGQALCAVAQGISHDLGCPTWPPT